MRREEALKILERLGPALQSYGVTDIALFGSVARDAATADSDVDILIDFVADGETFDNFLAVVELLESNFSLPVDAVTRNGLGVHVAPYVEREAVHAKIA
ncbi:MAG: nucleotidyltransferase domain-containing protein [Alkalispirochaeta sp.]|jgi:predicted nucleotidyltransferase